MGKRVLLAALWVAVTGAGGFAEKKPWKDESVQIGDIKMHYLEAGSGDRHLIFIPGWTMVAEVWQEQIPYFAARGYHVLAIDPRSHGQTTRTEEGNTYHQQAADLHAFIKELGLHSPYLVGWSAGVTVLLEYLSSPESAIPEKLVLVDGQPAGFKDGDYPGGYTNQQARTALMAMQDDRKKAADQFVRGMFKARQTESLYAELIEGSLKTPTGTAASLLFDLFTGDHRTALLRVRVPTLIVVSLENRLVGEYMQSRIKGSELEVIQDAGHALFLEKPQTFNQTLEDFLGKP